MSLRRLVLFACLFVATCVVSAGNCARAAEPPAVDFQKDIQPILQARCVSCHGTETQKAALSLVSWQSITKGGESGDVVVPNEPDKSSLYEKVLSGEMPPEGEDKLTSQQLQLIKQWIEAGARGPVDESSGSPSSGAKQTLDQHNVLPIFMRHCTACHGRNRQEGQLDLRSIDSMMRGGKSGAVVVNGKPLESRIVERIRSGQMPPGDRLVEASVKPVDPVDLEVLSRWIEAGMPTVADSPDVANGKPDPLVNELDRDFWSFRTPQPVAIPLVKATTVVNHPIDAFILNKLQSVGLGMSPPADRATLLRRVTFDLTGLPPKAEDVVSFLNDEDPQAYEKIVDRLLDSPQYGEQAGRHWLDLAGYADSEGKREQDLPRPHAWRYRDYVIRSFNADKPHDQFLIEQLAGDELHDYQHAEVITQEIYDCLVATGFLRMAPDASWANITGYLPDRIDVIADEMDVLGSAVLGLSIKCARCHSHKFDPIPQRDYYRVLAVFKGAYDEYDWLKPDVKAGLGPVSQDVVGGRLLPYVTTQEQQAWKDHEARISAEVQAAKERSEPEAAIKALEAKRQSQPQIQALWDRGEPTPTYIYRRGDPLNPGQYVGPGVLSVLCKDKSEFIVQPPWPGASQTGRRLAFAKWLTDPAHPLTARVRVNQIWQQHFGRGIVPSLANFGRAGIPPTHPELLDWLALEYIRLGWSTKALHRLIVTSATYQQSSAITPEIRQLDPDNHAYSRMPMKRLSAEQLYDALLATAGQLDQTAFGPADTVSKRADGLISAAKTDRGWRRAIYVQQTRKLPMTHLETFDFPQMNPNCIERRDSMVAPQALHLMNNGMVSELADAFARRVMSASPDQTQQLEQVYRLALGRPPQDVERQLGIQSLQRLQSAYAEVTEQQDAATLQFKALAAYCHVILNSANFLFVD